MGTHFLLQEILPTQGSNLDLLPCRQILYHLSHQGSPRLYVDASTSSWKSGLNQSSVEFFVKPTQCPILGSFSGRQRVGYNKFSKGSQWTGEDDKWVISISTVWYHGSDGENGKEEQASLMQEVTLSWDLEAEQEISLAEHGWSCDGKNSSSSQKGACHLWRLQTV